MPVVRERLCKKAPVAWLITYVRDTTRCEEQEAKNTVFFFLRCLGLMALKPTRELSMPETVDHTCWHPAVLHTREYPQVCRIAAKLVRLEIGRRLPAVTDRPFVHHDVRRSMDSDEARWRRLENMKALVSRFYGEKYANTWFQRFYGSCLVYAKRIGNICDPIQGLTSESTIRDLRHAVIDQTSLKMDCFTMIYAGRVLSDENAKLKDVLSGVGATVHVVPRMRGC